MQLPDKSGIACDLCGMACRQDFVYYSYDFRAVDVTSNRRPPLDSIVQSTVIFSLDVCPICFDKHKQTIITNYAKIMSPQRRVITGTLCELTGQLLVGTYNYYYCTVAKVTVRMSVKPVQVRSEDRHVEFSTTEDMYKKLTDTAGTVRKVAGEWSTKS